MEKFFAEVKPVVDYSVISLCCKSYHNHKKGCPNFLKKKGCPPNCPKIEDVIDLSRTVYCIYNAFPIGEHMDRMKTKYPDWTIYQLRCCLYWQPKARKQLKEKIKLFIKQYPNLVIVGNPEGCGVNVTETMKGIGINLEWPPEKYAYQIVLAGEKNEIKRFTK